MAKYMILYRSSMSPEEQMSGGDPEQMKEAMTLWMNWMTKAGPALVDFGSPLGNSHVVPGGGAGGPGYIGGYSILQADSRDQVTALLEDHPHFHSPDASIEVLEVLPVPGM